MTPFVAIIIGAGILAAGLAFIGNWLALRPWQRSQNEHWTERARLVHPVVVAARANLWAIPACIVLGFQKLWPDTSHIWFLVGTAAFMGSYTATLPMDYKLFPRVFVPDWLRWAIIGITLRYLTVFIFLGTAVFMPEHFTLVSLLLTAAAVLWVTANSLGGGLWLGRKLGFYYSASERLLRIVNETSARMNTPYREVWVMRSQMAQAYAYPPSRRLIFTERILELLPDDELAAICAHELAHLTEPKSAYRSRHILHLTFLPWIFFHPLVYGLGAIGFYGLLFLTVLIPRIYNRVSLRLEKRADQIAKDQTSDPAIYTRALVRLYEDNLIPAVTSTKRRHTHPDLYDRILAAGVTPDFPHPKPANGTTFHSLIFVVIAILLFMGFTADLIGSSRGICGHWFGYNGPSGFPN